MCMCVTDRQKSRQTPTQTSSVFHDKEGEEKKKKNDADYDNNIFEPWSTHVPTIITIVIITTIYTAVRPMTQTKI